MSAATIFTAKVLGTLSIGLWAGYNASLVHNPKDALPRTSGLKRLFRKENWKNLDAEKLKDEVQALVADAKKVSDENKARKTGRPACKNACASSSDSTSPLVGNSADSPFTAATLVQYSVRALHVSALSGVAFAGNFIAYSLSSASGKHPYLLYLALGAPLVGALQYYGARKLLRRGKSIEDSAAPQAGAVHSNDDSEEDPDVLDEMSNSSYEHVRSPASSSGTASSSSPAESSTEDSSIEVFSLNQFSLEKKYTIFSTVVLGLSTFLYAISVVGLAGDPARI